MRHIEGGAPHAHRNREVADNDDDAFAHSLLGRATHRDVSPGSASNTPGGSPAINRFPFKDLWKGMATS